MCPSYPGNDHDRTRMPHWQAVTAVSAVSTAALALPVADSYRDYCQWKSEWSDHRGCRLELKF